MAARPEVRLNQVKRAWRELLPRTTALAKLHCHRRPHLQIAIKFRAIMPNEGDLKKGFYFGML